MSMSRSGSGSGSDPAAPALGRSPDAKVMLQALLDARAYRHRVYDLRIIETHISWVLLTGEFAYKIKKPVDLGFVDFSTLTLRRQACLDELRLNRRYAPQLYLAVVPIGGTPEHPLVDDEGVPFEYAVKMRQFPSDQQLDRLLADGHLDMGDIEELAATIAALHAAAPVAPPDLPYGWPARIQADAEDNLRVLSAGSEGRLRAHIADLAAWTRQQDALLSSMMHSRRETGHVREVHGDLHLANLVRLDKVIVAFDCIEFSAALRWNDCISDLAFLTMDLHHRGHGNLAYHLLNRYLEIGGDYAGLSLLRYYEVYRALVRAKVALLRCDASSGPERSAQARQYAAYVRLARRFSRGACRALVLMHGLSGSGKTWLSTQLMSALPAVRVRSDVERKRLHGLAEGAHSGSAVDAGLYDATSSARTYDRLAALVTDIIDAGETAIVDAAFLRSTDRQHFRVLAHRLAIPFAIVSCQAPASALRGRLAARTRTGRDASEADQRVLEHQCESAEALATDERSVTVHVMTEGLSDVGEVLARLRRILFGTADAADAQTPRDCQASACRASSANAGTISTG